MQEQKNEIFINSNPIIWKCRYWKRIKHSITRSKDVYKYLRCAISVSHVWPLLLFCYKMGLVGCFGLIMWLRMIHTAQYNGKCKRFIEYVAQADWGFKQHTHTQTHAFAAYSNTTIVARGVITRNNFQSFKWRSEQNDSQDLFEFSYKFTILRKFHRFFHRATILIRWQTNITWTNSNGSNFLQNSNSKHSKRIDWWTQLYPFAADSAHNSYCDSQLAPARVCLCTFLSNITIYRQK